MTKTSKTTNKTAKKEHVKEALKETPETASKTYLKPSIKKLDKSRVEIIGSIPTEHFESFRKKALQNINDEVTVDGFRKGKVPEAMLIAKVGEMMILEEMAELALSRAYPEIVVEEKIDVLGRPEIQITKIAAGNPLEYKITTAIVPEIKLGDYKKISKDVMSKKVELDPVTDAELEDAILRVRRSRADHTGHSHENMTAEEHTKIVDASLPELNDVFVQSLGNFKDVSDFKTKMREMLFEDKKDKENEKKRIIISDQLIETSMIDVPEVLIESELKRIEAQFEDDVTRMGVKIDDYLKHAKKSLEDIRKEWKPHAEKKAKLQLILNKIGTDEKVTVDPLEIENEVNHIVEHYKDADRERAAVYAETVLMNEKIFQLLEKGNYK